MCATSYPGGLDSFSTKVDSVTDVMAAHINDVQDAIEAIETELGTQPRHTTTTAPTSGDDTNDGYSVGTLWTDTTNDRIYICIDNSAAAAIWHQIANVIAPKTAAPTVNDDSGDGYIDGDLWIDTTNDRVYILVDNTATAAIWQEITANYVERMPAMAFYTVTGTPAQGTLGDGSYGMATWRLDDSSTEIVGAAFEYKGGRGASSCYIDVWWAMETATSGSVRLRTAINAFADGEDSTSSPANQAQNIAVPSTAKYLKRTTYTVAEAFTVGDLIVINVLRNGSDGSDTASGDLHFCTATVRFI